MQALPYVATTQIQHYTIKTSRDELRTLHLHRIHIKIVVRYGASIL